MKNKETEKRLYCLVPYNISNIQKGIQVQHCASEYGEMYNREYIRILNQGKIPNPYVFEKYKDWINNWKTTIILNGGTTNNDKESKYYGTLQQHRDKLKELGVNMSEFYEPDLNDALTCICFIVDMKKDWIVLNYLKDLKLA